MVAAPYRRRTRSPASRTALRHVVFIAVAAALTVACAREPGRRAFVERLGTDTIAVEAYRRTAEGFEGDLLVRSPVTRRAHYEAELSPDGTIRELRVEWTTPPENPEGPPRLALRVRIEGDTATIDVEGAENGGTRRVEVPRGVIPTLGRTPLSFAIMEQATMQATAAGGDNVPVAFLSARRARAMPNAVVRVGGDTVALDFFGSPLLARVDAQGRLLWRSGARTTVKVTGEPADGVDIAALAADFAARDARGAGLGVPSPLDTVEASIAGASLRVIYSRPAKRGRRIWGGLVPYGEVWRTGANAATAFSTDRDLEISGVVVPAGDYTLYSIYTPESARLIINRQTGQWGTVYDAERDLARVEMTGETLPEPVERFTIVIEPTEDGGMLSLAWDTTRFRVPFRVR
jgi:hypothetical protein